MAKAANAIRDEILVALKTGPLHIRQICAAIDRDYLDIFETMRYLREQGKIITIGKCGDHGITDIRKDAPIYALPHTRKLTPHARPPFVKSGSGVFPSRKDYDAPFKPLNPKTLEHMKLAMAARR